MYTNGVVYLDVIGPFHSLALETLVSKHGSTARCIDHIMMHTAVLNQGNNIHARTDQ